MNTKYRIVAHDPLNWAIQEWREVGVVVAGKNKGKPYAEGWKAPKLFYPTLETAVKGLLNKALLARCQGEGDLDTHKIQRALRFTERDVLRALERLEAEVSGLSLTKASPRPQTLQTLSLAASRP